MQKLRKHSEKHVPVVITDTLSYGTPEYMSALLQLQVSSIPSCSRHVVRQKSIGSITVWLPQTGVQQREHTEFNVLQPSIRQPGNAARLISCQQTLRGAFRMTGLMGHDRNSWSCIGCSP